MIGTLIFKDNATNAWARISEVAAKVGVEPYKGGSPTICATGADGNRYDIWEVIIAVLDKMEKSSG